MTNLNLLNDPEYRWQHKEEMAKIMPYPSKRNDIGIVVIDYNILRMENDKSIKESTKHEPDWDYFKKLIYCFPIGWDKTRTKKQLTPADHLHFETRDRGRCHLCGSIYHYGSSNEYSYKSHNYKQSQLHHIIPNGDASEQNIITLCIHCHQIVHQALYISGQWKFGRPL